MTPHPEASPAPVSDRPPVAPPGDAPLIRPAAEIADPAALDARLDAVVALHVDPLARRTAAVAVLSDARKAGLEAIETGFLAAPTRARETVRAYAWLTDVVVRATLRLATLHLHPLPTPTSSERVAVLAVGGYGRAEMAPGSDVDLLFLTPWKVTPWAESVIESMLYIFWDLHLKVGHSTRTVKDCVRLGREDYTIRTALLEHRHIGGDPDLSRDLTERLWRDLFRSTGPDFVEAKMAERDARLKKQGDRRYTLEPNVKEGKGGLRDLQSLFWIAKYLHRAESPRALLDLGFFRPEEYDAFDRAETFLWAVRCHLHLIAGRASDQLTFDMQVEVARRLGYADGGGRRAVEHFMQDYFRHATRVGELTRIFLTALEASHVKKEPALTRLLRRPKAARPPYRINQNRLDVGDETAFLADKLNLLRVFEEALRTGVLLHPNTMRLIAANLHRIDDEVRQSPEAQGIFLDLMLKHGNPERALRRMNELGALSAFIPEFEPIVAMMQFNMYHHYTVDEHTIQCISTLAQIERGELVEELPIASRILKDGVNRKVLFVALLLHDIGKGRPEDHSILGAQIARKVAPRLGLTPEDSETVEWLVRHHLVMSDTAQKRDISDPRTVRDFAKTVRSRKRLDLLTVLTVCDIRGVGPNTWNNWKAMLLRGLYRQTADALDTGIEDLNREQRETEAKRALREALADWPAKDIKAETARHYSPYWQGLDTGTQAVFARLLRGMDAEGVRVDMHPDAGRDATRACFVLADHPGIFSRLAGALALVGANVVDARTYTSKDGYATAVFWVQDAEGTPYDEDRLPRLRQMIERTLKGEVVAREALKSKDKIRKRERDFEVPTSIHFDNDASDIYTLIEVDTRDRPGLLHDLTRTLAANNIYIASAVIATFGAQAVDTFYVKDMFGLKLYGKPKREALEKKLRAAISEGAERARLG